MGLCPVQVHGVSRYKGRRLLLDFGFEDCDDLRNLGGVEPVLHSAMNCKVRRILGGDERKYEEILTQPVTTKWKNVCDLIRVQLQ